MTAETASSQTQTKKPDAGAPAQEPDAPDSSPEKTSGKKEATPGVAGSVAFDEDIEIRVDKRLPEYDVGPVKAYAARGSGKKSGEYIAIVCEKDIMPRSRAFPVYAKIINPALARLVTAGVVYWPSAGEQKLVLLYENTLGKPLLKVGEKAALDWRQEDVLETILPSMVSVLIDFRDKDFVHGNIRPTNMFDGGTASGGRVVLGECLSTPPSFAQPVLYETIERGMADPIARGLGTHADDMYAFGVSLAVILRGSDPMEGLDSIKIIRQKIEIGSYAAITGKDRFTGAILELLRGLLYDDPMQRWTIDDVQAWLDGQRLSPKQAAKKLRASRPLVFNGKKFFTPHQLAMDLGEDVSAAVTLIEEGTLEQWLERSLEDKLAIERMEKAVASAGEGGRGPGYWERLACYLSMALDPEAPLRYKGLSLRPDGIGAALARAIVARQEIQPYAELISQNVILSWLDGQENVGIDIGGMIGKFDSCRSYLKQTAIGYGLERCLYTICPESHCLSEKLRPYYVRSPEDLMYAFEDMISRGDAPAAFFDRHICAFLSVKDSKTINSYLPDLNADEPYRKALGTLKALANIQQRSKMGNFPHIARHMASFLTPLYLRYHDRELRENFREKIDRTKEVGDLAKMSAFFENTEIIKKDHSAFRRAMMDYYQISREKKKLEHKMSREGQFGRGTGRQIAALFSSAVAGLVIVGFMLTHFAGLKIF